MRVSGKMINQMALEHSSTTGDEITCDWKEGLQVGPCTINFKNGDRFTGECVDGRIKGYGNGLHIILSIG